MTPARLPLVSVLVAAMGFAPLVGCSRGGGGGGGGGGAPPATANVVASAGADVDAAAGTLVRLDATGSYEKTGAAITYAWTQTGGSPVVLSGATSASPTFVAPAGLGDLTFQVSVSNGTETAGDTIVVRGKPLVVKAGRLRTSQVTSNGGATVAGARTFTISGGTNFNASGVASGDTLFVLDGADEGAYRVNAVTNNTTISVRSPLPFAGSTPAAWAILNEVPQFWGYGLPGTLQALLLGSPVGSLSFAWSGVPSFMAVSGASTAALSFTTPTLPALMELPEEPGVLAVRGPAMGSAQLSLSVTDDNATPGDPSDDATDADALPFSVGIATSGLENVPLGEPVFLSGGTIRKQESNASFVLAGGTTFVYQVNEAAVVRGVREGQAPLLEAASVAVADATPGSWFWSGGVLYVHARESTPVPTNGKGYHAFVADSWAWTLTDPTGATIGLFRPDRTALGSATDERTPYFVPARLGSYSLILTRAYGSSEDAKAFNLTAGQYAGVGTIVGLAPDPSVGECGGCHGGSVPFLENKRATWQQTAHASTFERALDPSSSLWSAYQSADDWRDIALLRIQTVGASLVNPVDLAKSASTTTLPSSTASGHLPNLGLDDQALYRNWSHGGVAWDDLREREPSLAALGNVQCESCHGPGSLHAGITTGIRKSVDEGVCGRCHATEPAEWNASAHARLVVSPSANASCVNCHEAAGSVAALNLAAAGAEPRPVLFANASVPLPIFPEHERRGETCAVCHDPHKPTAGTAPGASSAQLRLVGQVRFMNGVAADAGKAALCYMCHQSRTNTADFTPATGHMALRRAPHLSTSAEMFAATNGLEYAGWIYQSSPHALPSAFVVAGAAENERCITCHMKVSPGPGESGHLAYGGHTWWMKQGGAGHPAAAIEVADEASHPGGAVLAGTKSFSVAGGASFLGRVYAGDSLVLENGSDAGTFSIASVDSARRLTVNAGANFGGVVAVTQWHVLSVPKYNTFACNQCHVAGPQFELAARGDYDGDGTIETVQEETEGMLEEIRAAVEAAINDPTLPKGLGGGPYTLTEASGRVAYRNAGGTTRAFPGPSGSSPQQTDWDALTVDQQNQWVKIYKAAFNFFFVENDRSEGIHNTGYAVNLLQASHFDLTGLSLGDPFVPIPGYGN